jgi:hypothetical protein
MVILSVHHYKGVLSKVQIRIVTIAIGTSESITLLEVNVLATHRLFLRSASEQEKPAIWFMMGSSQGV